MKLPSWTARTRSADGLNVTVSDRPDRRDAFVADRATVYGPPPTRKSVPGGVTTICAPALAITGFAAGVVTGAGEREGAQLHPESSRRRDGRSGGGWTAVVPGIGELPGGMIETPPAPAAGGGWGTGPGPQAVQVAQPEARRLVEARSTAADHRARGSAACR
jgi:hypothetical protein